jgi:hypothetical protein
MNHPGDFFFFDRVIDNDKFRITGKVCLHGIRKCEATHDDIAIRLVVANGQVTTHAARSTPRCLKTGYAVIRMIRTP